MDPEQAVDFDSYMPVIQRFVVVMYERTSSATSVNEARLQMFAQRGREIDAIPPTEAALLQHSKTAIYQGALVWGNALDLSPKLPSPSDYVWLWTNKWPFVGAFMDHASGSSRRFLSRACSLQVLGGVSKDM